ncbi:MFS family permease [Bradyrhizobium sp. i1.8.4]|uniref:hypothetical protein n=1 Tax=unclassified Bradyrhizobium TaxID=2631580 RepID=UPI003D1CD7F6
MSQDTADPKVIPTNGEAKIASDPPAQPVGMNLSARIWAFWTWIRSHKLEALGTAGLMIALAFVVVAGLIWTDQGKDLLQAADVWYRGLALFSGLTVSLVTLEGLIILLIRKDGEPFDIETLVSIGGLSALVMGIVATLHNNIGVGILVFGLGWVVGVFIPAMFSGFLNYSSRFAANGVGAIAAVILFLLALAPNTIGDTIGSALALTLAILAWVFVIFALAAAGYMSGRSGRGTWLLVLVASSMWAVKSLVVLAVITARGYPILDYVRHEENGPKAEVPSLEAAYANWRKAAGIDDQQASGSTDSKAADGVSRQAVRSTGPQASSTNPVAAGKTKPILVLVGAAGGGIRASFWTSLIMMRLADNVPKFRQELFASSGVSGGSLGLGVSYGLLAAQDATCAADGKKESCVRIFHDGDFLSGVVGATVAGLPANALFPRSPLFPSFPRRDDALETSWENRWESTVGSSSASAHALAKPIGALWGRDEAHPLLVLNATTASSGDRAVSADVKTKDWINLRTTCHVNITEEMNPFLSASIGASARFPFVSDLGWVNVSNSPGCKEREAVADGGFYDNYGAATLKDLILGLQTKGHADFDKVHLVVVQITSDPLREMGCLFRKLDEDGTDSADDFCKPGPTKPTWWSGFVDGPANLFQSKSGDTKPMQPSATVEQIISTFSFLMQNAAFGGNGPGVVDIALQARAATGIDVAKELRDLTCRLHGSYYHLGMTDAEDIPLGWALSQTSQDRLTAILNDKTGYRNKRLNRLIRELNDGTPGGQC